ncbi:MAG TPA: PEP-utilizing enzyme [Dehalococcoidia bacterium]|nr:PEP-utilizing enzyme [Dehalococcoidia bacterium]
MPERDWENAFPAPDQVDGFWGWDSIHAPRPLTPLSGTTVWPALGQGFTKAMGEISCLLALDSRTFNYYAYANFHGVDTGAETPESRNARYLKILDEFVPNVGKLWREEWQPTLVPLFDNARHADYASMTDEQLWANTQGQFEDLVYRWTIHGRINFQLVGASWFVDFYNENFHPEEQTEAYEALQGFHTKSVEAGRGLWRLRGLIKASPALIKVFSENEPRALAAALVQSDEGKAFLKQLRDFLEVYGWRSDAAYELDDPTWWEDPSIALSTLQGYVNVGEDADPDVGYNRAVARREELLARARERLKDDPKKLERFNWLYEAGKDNLPVAEDHNYYIDQAGVVILRLPLLEIGRRMVAKGTVSRVEDVFYFYRDELGDAFLKAGDQKALIAKRRAEHEAASKIVPPPALGTPGPAPEDPFAEALVGKMLGVGRTPEPDKDPDVIRGIAGSPGTIQGIAKVVRSLNEASKLQQGDIMVCQMTLPPWTPLFATAGGLVADTGGILSHCAIVAREYRLPAVVGTLVGTHTIQDGWTITVDGTKGIVRIDKRT